MINVEQQTKTIEQLKTNIMMGKYQETYEFIQELFKNNNDIVSRIDFQFEYAKLLYVMKKYSESIIEFKEILRCTPKDINSLIFLSKMYKEQFDCFKTLRVLLYIKKHRLLPEEEINDLIVNSLLFMKRNEIVLFFLQQSDSRDKHTNLIDTLIDEIIQDMKVKNSNGKSLKNYEKLVYKGNDLIDVKRKNILLNEYEIFERKSKLKSFPRTMALSLTNRCNLKCKMCLQQMDNNAVKRDISKEKLLEIEKFFPYLEVVIWTGGEAFLHPQFEHLLDEAYKYKVKQLITTNGTLITQKIAEKIVKYDIELTLSIDSIYKESYEYIRTGSNFDILINKICIINAYREAIKNTKMNLCMQYVISKDNIDENLLDVLDFCKKYKITQISFLFDKYEENIDIKNKVIREFSKIKQVLLQKAEYYNIKLFYYIPTEIIEDDYINDKDFNNNETNNKQKEIINKMNVDLSSTNKECDNQNKKNEENDFKQSPLICSIPWKALYIDYNFEVFCECFDNFHNVMGNLHHQSLEEIWNGNRLVNFRKELLEEKALTCGRKCQPINFK